MDHLRDKIILEGFSNEQEALFWDLASLDFGLPKPLSKKKKYLRKEPAPEAFYLIAKDQGGASLCFHAQSPSGTLKKFDKLHDRDGYMIEIFNPSGTLVRVVKKTYR